MNIVKTIKTSILTKILIAMFIGSIIGSYNAPGVSILISLKQVLGSLIKSFLPVLAFISILNAIISLQSNAKAIIIITIIASYVGTVTAGIYSATLNYLYLPTIIDIDYIKTSLDNMQASHIAYQSAFSFKLKPFLDIGNALFFSLLFGIGINFSNYESKYLKNFIKELYEVSIYITSKIILGLIPLYIMCVFTDIAYQGSLMILIKGLYKIFFIIIFLHFTIIISIYTIVFFITGKNPLLMLYNMIPTYITAMGAQSSLIVSPQTLIGMQKNGMEKSLASFITFIFANFHMPGSMSTLMTSTTVMLMIYGFDFTLIELLLYVLILGFFVVGAPGMTGAPALMATMCAASYFGVNEVQQGIIISIHFMQSIICAACNCVSDGGVAFIVRWIASFFVKDPSFIKDSEYQHIKK